MTDAPSPFSTVTPKFQTSWDSTSLGWLKTCPRYYEYQMLEGWSPKSKGIHLAFGGWYASGVEMYAHARASGSDHTAAQIAMVRWVLENSGTRPHVTIETECDGEVVQSVCMNCNRVNDVLGLRQLDEDGGRCPKGMFTPWSPGDHKDANIKNRYTLIRSLVWNTEDRLGSPFKTVILANGKPAVELSFNFHAFDVEGEPISLSGHMDELVENTHDGTRWVKDDKTTKGALGAYYFQGYSPDNQMSLYTIAGKIILNKPISGVLVRAAQIGVNFTRFATAQVPRPAAVLTEWLADAQWWVAQACSMAIANYWPMNDKACGNYGGCVFQKVCSVSPTHRKAWLEEDFERREWNPLAVRGDI